MKKIILTVFLSTLLIVGLAQAKQLWEYHLTNQEEANIALQGGIIANFEEYDGSLNQNLGILAILQNQENLGSSNPATAVEWYLATPHSSTVTTINTVDFKDIRGNSVPTSSMPTKIYLTIEPDNKSNTEIVMCPLSGMDATNTQFTSCTRGLAFYGSSNESVTANKKSHPAGAKVIMSNPSQFFNLFVDTWTNQNVTGTKSFTSGVIKLGNNVASTTDKCVYAYNGDTYSPYICYEEGTSKWLLSNNGVDSYDIQEGGGGLDASGTLAIRIDGGRIGIRLNNEEGGLKFYQGNPTSTLGIKFAPNGGFATSSGGIHIATSTAITWNASSTFRATSTHQDLLTAENGFYAYEEAKAGVALTTNDLVYVTTTRREFYKITTGANYADIHGNNWTAQVFTTNLSYTLDKVVVKIQKNGSPTGNYTVSIRATSAGLPTGADLVASSTAASSLTTAFEYKTINLPNLDLVAGTQYAIVIGLSGGDASNCVRWDANGTGTYTGGTLSNSTNGGAAWTADANSDANFQTYYAYTLPLVVKVDTDVVSSTEMILGFAKESVSAGARVKVQTLKGSIISGFIGLGEGWLYFPTATAGGISTTTPVAANVRYQIGWAISPTQLLFDYHGRY